LNFSGAAVANGGAIIFAPHRHAHAILDFKKQRARRSHFHLLVISRRLKRLAPPEQRLIEFGGAFDRGAEQGLREIVKIFFRRIEQDHAPLRKHPRKEQRKRAAQSFSRTIRLAQPGRNFGISQQSCGSNLTVPTGASAL
jgi:hypothetical protein